MLVKELKEKYNTYLFQCHNEGDIWHEDNRPYTFVEWEELGYPEHGGISLFPCPSDKVLLKVNNLLLEWTEILVLKSCPDDPVVKEYEEKLNELNHVSEYNQGTRELLHNEYMLKYIKSHWDTYHD